MWTCTSQERSAAAGYGVLLAARGPSHAETPFLHLQLALLHRRQGNATLEQAAIAHVRSTPHRYSAVGDQLAQQQKGTAVDLPLLTQRMHEVRQTTKHKGGSLVTLDLR